MERMRFHWENEEGTKQGSFKVEAPTVEDCIEIAKDEIEGAGYVITDYYTF